ncbi:T9SS type A sorting domain-containing protein, partial [Flavobacterium orientale]|uniref:T9SS type A sorting domain-containing protein n=1 Tax=Flavobacterium orientale TaxID=1756020 RepID=UPI00166689D3
EGCGPEGIAPASLNTVIYVRPSGVIQEYRYILSDDNGYYQIYESTQRAFRLSNFNDLSPLTPGGVYSIDVEYKVYGYYYGGKTCAITVPGGTPPPTPDTFTRYAGSESQLSNEFSAIAYPNPFNNSFNLDIKGNQTTPVQVTVYDMMGRLLENNTISVDQANNINIGANYPTGVYNVVVTQGEEVKMIRVVKQ